MTTEETPNRPSLPVDPRIPGHPTAPEVDAARTWLYRRGVVVQLPTRLLAVRAGARHVQLLPNVLVVFLLAYGTWTGSTFAGETVFGGYRGLVIAAAYAVWTLVRWQGVRSRDVLAGYLMEPGGPLPPRMVAAQLGGWYLASLVITFGGGAALYGTLLATRPASPAGPVLALAVGLVPAGLVLGHIFGARVLAEDEPSAVVDRLLRAQDAHLFAMPAPYAVFAGLTGVTGWTGGWLLYQAAYVVLAAGTQLVGWLLERRRTLPPGWYGLPVPR